MIPNGCLFLCVKNMVTLHNSCIYKHLKCNLGSIGIPLTYANNAAAPMININFNCSMNYSTKSITTVSHNEILRFYGTFESLQICKTCPIASTWVPRMQVYC